MFIEHHPFADGNGRRGRLWQTVILSKWKSFFVWLPVESVVCDRQNEYYQALRAADMAGNATIFVEFMLSIILDAIKSGVKSDQVTDQVRKLLAVLSKGECKASRVMTQLDLTHRPTFRKNYLHPALKAGFIEMTNPDSPGSLKQKYLLTEKGKLLCKDTNGNKNSLRKKEERWR